jgi:outer membrane protein
MKKNQRIAQPRSVAMNQLKLTVAASACLAALAGTPAFAQDSNEARIGVYQVFYDVRADDVSGPFTPPGLNATVSNVTTLYLAYLRRLNSNFTLELTAGIPPTTDTIAKGPATLGAVPWNDVKIGSVKWFAPSLLVEYNFFEEGTAFRPFVGLGVNFTHFYDRQINAAGAAALGGPTSVSLNNSVGPAATVGATYHFMGHFTATASYSMSRVESTLEANTSGIVRRTHVSFNPQVLVASVGYTF